MSGVLVAAVTWGIGSTVFRGALVERGLPETVNEASDDERTMWELGAQLEDLASQARKLAELAPGNPRRAWLRWQVPYLRVRLCWASCASMISSP